MRQLSATLALWAALTACAQAAEPITLGLNYPRTGPYKEEGLAQMRGALLAIDEINAAGGVLGRPLRLSSKDTASRPAKAEKNVDKLAAEGAAMLFGGSSSAVAIAAGKRARQHGLLYFGTLTYSNDTTGKDGHRYMFRECNNAWMSAKVLGQYLSKTLPNKRYFYVTADYTWGHTSEASLRQATATDNAAQHASVRIPFPGARLADYQDALTQAAASNAEILALVLFGEDLVRAMRVAKDLGLTERMQIVAPNLTQSMVEQAGPNRALDLARACAGKIRAWPSLRRSLQDPLRDVPIQLRRLGLQHRSTVGRRRYASQEPRQRSADQGAGRPPLHLAQRRTAMACLRPPEPADGLRGKGQAARRGTQGPAQAGLLRNRRPPRCQQRAAQPRRVAGRAPRWRPTPDLAMRCHGLRTQ